MAHQIQSHEGQQDGAGKAGQDISALETEGVADGAAMPDVEVGPDVNEDADEGTHGIEEEQPRERRQRQRPGGVPLYVGGGEEVAETPAQAGRLLARHGVPALAWGREREGGGQLEGSFWCGFEEDLVRDGGVFVAVTTSLPHALDNLPYQHSLHFCFLLSPISRQGLRTDFPIDPTERPPAEYCTGVKLKGLFMLPPAESPAVEGWLSVEGTKGLYRP